LVGEARNKVVPGRFSTAERQENTNATTINQRWEKNLMIGGGLTHGGGGKKGALEVNRGGKIFREDKVTVELKGSTRR